MLSLGVQTHQPPGRQSTPGGVKGKRKWNPVVIRRLPPSISKEQLEEQLHPLPAHDYFEFCAADPSLYPHLFSRAYINFRNPEDILLFRDRFDGFIFIDNKGQEYPAVVEFAPFQKISKKKLKKKDTKAGSITDDLEYKKFLENYCADEEKVCANPETLLGEIEAKTKELIGLCLMICLRNANRIREEKREERRRRELEKKRLREEEKRKRREEERRKRKEADKQKKMSEKEIRIKVRGFLQNNNREMEQERPRFRMDDRKQRTHYEFEKFMRRNEDEQKWGKGYNQDRGKKGIHNSSFAMDAVDKLGKEDKCDDMVSTKERIRNKLRLLPLFPPAPRHPAQHRTQSHAVCHGLYNFQKY
uniref:UPF3A regulator of nonsense mediated mRNA decay n=1 Tax=Leptobrachium leishanense TaxID=445787 RepID=A0A8C5N3C1_9ANUR